MRDGRPVVVPFERPAAYWAARARRLKAPHQLPDAARLMRKAYEKNRQIKLSIPALVAVLWIIRGFAAVRKADGIVSGFII